MGGPLMHFMPSLRLYYLLWFIKIFLKYCTPERPVVLVQDGHKSHLTVDLINLARANDVILFNLPLHTTHTTQPLDKNISSL